tara:strand:+ start:263 stop:418 length:156 start_codon:yes stop_codon:yes gene_type:complete
MENKMAKNVNFESEMKKSGRAEFAQESAKTEQGKGSKGFAYPTEGYVAVVE